MQTPEGCLGRQSRTGVCHDAGVIIPKARRLPANNTTAHSWPEISSPKHPRHVRPRCLTPVDSTHPQRPPGGAPGAGATGTDALARGLALSALQGPLRDSRPHRQDRRSVFTLRSGLNYRLSSLRSSPSTPDKRSPRHLQYGAYSSQAEPGQRARYWRPPPPPPLLRGVWAPHLTPPSPQLDDITDTVAILQVP